MRIAVPKERRPQERRVAVSPDTAKRLVGMGHEVVVEAGAGVGAAFLIRRTALLASPSPEARPKPSAPPMSSSKYSAPSRKKSAR